jgi:hypothetical protein
MIDHPGDRYEREADRVADQILRMPATDVRTVRAAPGAVSPETQALLPNLETGGAPLAPALRSFFEPRLGRGFEDVRVHDDAAATASAQALAALAYTRGRHIVFGAGQFEPHTARGQRLLAHELTHVVQQGGAGGERIQPSSISPTEDQLTEKEIPPLAVREEELPAIQRKPDPGHTPAGPPTSAVPTLTLTPGDTLLRGETLTAALAFKSSAGERLKVTGWQFTTVAGDRVTRPAGPKFQSEWAGVMALSGSLSVNYTIKPNSGAAEAGTPITSAVTLNPRTGPDWQTTVTDLAETPLTGKPSPPEWASDLGQHDANSVVATAAQVPITDGPNDAFTFVNAVTDAQYTSTPHVHPDVLDHTSKFGVFHRSGARLYFKRTGGPRVLIPPAEYTVVSIAGGKLKFTVLNWTTFYKKYGVLRITLEALGRKVPAKDDWWALSKNTELSNVEIIDQDAVRIALGRGNAPTPYTIHQDYSGEWQNYALMTPEKILIGTRSHEYVHATHSHRANTHKIVRALDPRRIGESMVSTPSSPVNFNSKLVELQNEITKPNHEIVDEQASTTAEHFVAAAGKMAGVNTDPDSGANLGTIWDITHDDQLVDKPRLPRRHGEHYARLHLRRPPATHRVGEAVQRPEPSRGCEESGGEQDSGSTVTG